MSTTLPDGALEQIEREQQHFDLAPYEFFQAWKRGVAIAGHTWFGNGTQESLSNADCIWDLCPRMADITFGEIPCPTLPNLPIPLYAVI